MRGRTRLERGCRHLAIATILWRGIQGSEAVWSATRGLDKKAQVALKDQLLERMKQEGQHPAPRPLASASRAALPARSRARPPLPAVRFPRLDELQTRLEEVLALVRPR